MSDVFGSVLIVGITIVLVATLYALRFPLQHAPPTVMYQIVTDSKRPVWGDPTDCYPNLPYPPSYYLGNGSTGAYQTRYNDYMQAWQQDCMNGDNGTYNMMNVTLIEFTEVSSPISLSNVELQFLCTNYTPTYVRTTLVQGVLSAMEWEPGQSENLSTSAPTLSKCATYDASGQGADSVYYNRMGYFDPVNFKLNVLAPAETMVVYVHTDNSVVEAPNTIEPSSTWNKSDPDDYHGAPPWCFTVPNACEINFIDTAVTPNVLLTSVPLYQL